MQENQYSAIIIYGPTASGKSAFGVELAKKIHGEIINCDSTQIYKDLPILTAQPTRNEMHNIPHHLYGILNQDVKINAILWIKYLIETLKKIPQKTIPIIIGGTGLYINALINNGFNYIPEISKDTKDKVHDIISSQGINYAIKEIQIADPNIFDRISIKDTQRILRAFEVLVETKKPISFWWNKPKQKFHFTNQKFLKVYLKPERDIVYNKCESRFYKMLEMGAISEVINFVNKYKDINKTQMSKIIGLSELQNVIEKEYDINTASKQIIQRTRHYAKRQFTWFNNKINHDIVIHDLSQIDKTIEEIKNIIH